MNLLRGVESWAMQLQGVDADHALRRIERATVDMVVIEPMRSVQGLEDLDVRALVERVHASDGVALARKRCVAYLNIGQAEDYRSYWKSGWKPPEIGVPGDPDFILGVDPDGWVGNYPVAYWRDAWRELLFGKPGAPLDQILEDGFDGIYIDWILGCIEPCVVAAAERERVDPMLEMLALLRDIRAYARERNPLFVMIAQNGVDLAERHPEFLELIDGFAHEDLSFSGSAAAPWSDPASGDVPAPEAGRMSTAELGDRLARIRGAGLPIFTIDYAIEADNVHTATLASRKRGFVPFVSRTPLDRLPDAIVPVAAPPK